MDDDNFKELIEPFFWVEHTRNASFCLNAGSYKKTIFESREQEGFEGNGYDWTSLAKVFLEERMPNLKGKIKFDPEAGMFCAYSSDQQALKEFGAAFKNACADDKLLMNLFSRAELD